MTELGFVHRFLPGTDRGKAFTLLLLHGTGGDENDLIPLGQSLQPGASLLSPRGKVLENGMPRFFRRLAEGVFDQEDLRRRTDELATFVAAARRSYSIEGKLIAVGFSNGANIAGSLMFRYPGLLSRAVLFRAMVPFVPEPSPDLRGTEILLSAGRFDTIASPDQVEQLNRIFSSAGATVTLRWTEAGHELRPQDIEDARNWLQQGRETSA